MITNFRRPSLVHNTTYIIILLYIVWISDSSVEKTAVITLFYLLFVQVKKEKT
jgi:hypothetical protein